jgi:CRP-like cAMP-binding protein
MSVAAREFTLSRPIAGPATSDQQAALIDELCQRGFERIYPPNSVTQQEGDAINSVKLVRSGWVVSEIQLVNGSRLIADIFLPRDIVHLPMIAGTARASARTIDAVRISEFPRVLFLGMIEHNPHLAAIVRGAYRRAEAARIEHMVRLGGLSTMARTAHLMLELGYRLNPGQEGGTLGFHCPLKQSDLADALGMTPIHVNRILRKLRVLGLMTFEKKRVTIPDYQRLCRLAEFNPAYLRNDGGDFPWGPDSDRAGSAWPGTYG